MRLKKSAALLLSLWMIFSMSITVFAQETTITTTVPASHTITVSADGAEVFCNGRPGSQFTVDRLSEPVLLIRAASGKEITRILLNGEDITTEVKGGYYTLAPVYEDQTLTVVTKDAPASQGKTYTLQGTVKRSGQPVKNITLQLRGPLKTDVTDKNGKFSFARIACGRYSLTALEDGEIVGYVEFVLTEGSKASISLSDNGIYAITVKRGDKGIDLTLNLKDDGTAVIENAAGVPGSGNQGGIPGTGDNVLFWQALMLIALAGLAALIYGKKRKSKK